VQQRGSTASGHLMASEETKVLLLSRHLLSLVNYKDKNSARLPIQMKNTTEKHFFVPSLQHFPAPVYARF
jgi:hypothetical protein